MIAGLLKVDEAIYESNKIICCQISRLGESTRGEVLSGVCSAIGGSFLWAQKRDFP